MMALIAGFGLSSAGQAALKAVLPCAARLVEAESHPARYTFTALPEVRGALSSVLAEPVSAFPLLSEWLSDDLAVLVYGEIYAVKHSQLAAEHVQQTYRQHGSAGVARLDGNFSAVVLDRQTRRITLICDRIGRRALRWHASSGSLWVSSSDVCLAALAPRELQPDLVSLASIAGVDWSLGGKSLLQGVRNLTPFQVEIFDVSQSDRVTHRSEATPPLCNAPRLGSRHSAELSRLRDEALGHLDDYFRHCWGGKLDVQISLSAGLDSRAALAVVRPQVSAAQLRVLTQGQDGDLEVSTASRISKLYGYDHTVVQPARSREHFEERLRRLAFYRNGDGDSKRCFSVVTAERPKHFAAGGEYGEIVRGYYYNGARGLYQTTDVAWARQLLERKFKRRKRYPLSDSAIASAVQQRLDDELDRYKGWSSSGHDLLDYFYLYERVGHWAPGSRSPADEWRCGVFGAPELASLAFRFPAPIGHYARIQQWLIKQRLPETRFIPLNGNQFVDTLGWPGAPYLSAGWRQLSQRLSRSVVRFGLRLPPLSSVATAEGAMMKELLCEGRHSFSGASSTTALLFGRERLNLWLAEQQAGKAHGALLGPLWTAEEFFKLCAELRRELSAVTVSSGNSAAPGSS
jgi:hypothetical protein